MSSCQEPSSFLPYCAFKENQAHREWWENRARKMIPGNSVFSAAFRNIEALAPKAACQTPFHHQESGTWTTLCFPCTRQRGMRPSWFGKTVPLPEALGNNNVGRMIWSLVPRARSFLGTELQALQSEADLSLPPGVQWAWGRGTEGLEMSL